MIQFLPTFFAFHSNGFPASHSAVTTLCTYLNASYFHVWFSLTQIGRHQLISKNATPNIWKGTAENGLSYELVQNVSEAFAKPCKHL